MITKAFSIRDVKAGTYNPPFFQYTPGMAERAVKHMMKDPGSMLGTYPSDFELFEVGSFDDESGRVETLQTPKFLVSLEQLKMDEGPEKLKVR